MRKNRQKQLMQDERRRANLAYAELAQIGGYLDRVGKLIWVQFVTASLVDFIGADIEHTLKSANLATNKTFSIQNKVRKATEGYFDYFSDVINEEMTGQWALDLDKLEEAVYDFANISEFKPDIDAMEKSKKEIEDKYKVKLDIQR